MASKFEFMSLDNLTVYHGLLSESVNSAISAAVADSIKTISQSSDGYTLYFYRTSTPTTEADASYSIRFPSPVDISGKMDKVVDAVTGNFAVFGQDGAVVDSGRKSTDFATSAQGAKADSAIQTIEESQVKGNILVDGRNVPVHGLGTAAYTPSDAYEPAGSVRELQNALNTEITSLNMNVTGLSSRMNAAEAALLDITDSEDGILASAKKYTDDGINGLKLSEYTKKAYVDTELAKKANKGDSYTKAETDTKITTVNSAISQVAGYVGTIPAESKATDVISYIKEAVRSAEEGARYDDAELRALTAANKSAIDTLNGTGAGSVKKQISDSIAAIVADAPESLNTLKEIADWINSHAESASDMNSRINANRDDIDDLTALVGRLPTGSSSTTIVAYIAEYVSKAMADSDLSQYAKAADLTAAVGRITASENEINVLKVSLADGGATASAIADAKKAGTDAQKSVSALSARVGTLPESAASETVIGYVDEKAGVISGSLTALTTRVTSAEKDIDSLQAFTTANADASAANAKSIAGLQTQVTANKTASDALRKYVGTYPPIEGVDTVVEYVDHKTQEAISKASYDDTGVQAGIQANKLAIEAVNDPANGILALAKADAASKASKALTDAKTYTDTLRDGAVASNSAAISKNAGEIISLQDKVGDGFTDIPLAKIRTLFDKE